MTLAVPSDAGGKNGQQRFAEFLRVYASLNTRLAYATDLGIPLDWVPGYQVPDPTRRRGRAGAANPPAWSGCPGACATGSTRSPTSASSTSNAGSTN